jgi:hypothetical protein
MVSSEMSPIQNAISSMKEKNTELQQCIEVGTR